MSRALVLLACSGASLAAADPVLVKGKFSVEPPSGWIQEDAEAAHEIAKQVARPLGIHHLASAKPPLIVFMATTHVGNFRNNLNVREVEGRPDVDEKNLAEYRVEM